MDDNVYYEQTEIINLKSFLQIKTNKGFSLLSTIKTQVFIQQQDILRANWTYKSYNFKSLDCSYELLDFIIWAI